MYNKTIFDNWDQRFADCLISFRRTGTLICVDCGHIMNKSDNLHKCPQCGLTIDTNYCIDVWVRNKSMAVTSQNAI